MSDKIKTRLANGEVIDLTTLPARMHFAATVLEDATEYAQARHADLDNFTSRTAWDPHGLRHAAKIWDASEREVAALGTELFLFIAGVPQEDLNRAARGLIKSGWRKADPA